MRAGLALALLIGTTLPTLAGEGFDIVIPGRPGVPVIINGVDASYAVVEGDFGLGKGAHMQPTVYGGRYVDVDVEPSVGHYYPKAGHNPDRAITDHGRRNPLRRGRSRRCRFIRRR